MREARPGISGDSSGRPVDLVALLPYLRKRVVVLISAVIFRIGTPVLDVSIHDNPVVRDNSSETKQNEANSGLRADRW